MVKVDFRCWLMDPAKPTPLANQRRYDEASPTNGMAHLPFDTHLQII